LFKRLYIVFATTFLSLYFGQSDVSHAQVSDQYLTSPEALAMGNAYVAVAEGAYSLFYNPAALSRSRRFSFVPFHGTVGVTSNFASAIKSVTSNSGVVNRINALSGKKLFAESFLFPHIQLPFLAFGGNITSLTLWWDSNGAIPR